MTPPRFLSTVVDYFLVYHCRRLLSTVFSQKFRADLMLRSGINRKNIVSTLYKWQDKCRKMNRFKPDARTEFSDLCAEPKILSIFIYIY